MANLEGIDPLTIVEANARIPLVRLIIQDLKVAWTRRRELDSELERFRAEAGRHSSAELQDTVRRLEAESRTLDLSIDELQKEVLQVGGIVKDPAKGLVDFLSEHDGHLLFLTWSPEDEKISYWHEIDAGLDELRPIAEESGLYC